MQSLSLGSNKIHNLEELKALSTLRDIVQLDCSDCPVAEVPEYRKFVFEMLPSLEILDNTNKNNEEMVYSDDQNISNASGGDDSGSEESSNSNK